MPIALRLRPGLTPGCRIVLRAEGEELRAIAAPSLLGRLRTARHGTGWAGAWLDSSWNGMAEG